MLQCVLEVATKNTNTLEIWVGLLQQDIRSKEGHNFFVCDGSIHILADCRVERVYKQAMGKQGIAIGASWAALGVVLTNVYWDT